MSILSNPEYAEKQLMNVVTWLYHTLHEDEEILVSPDNDNGIFKYTGTSPDAQFHLTKLSKKREVKRSGLGFVIQRATLSDRYRVSFDVEISDEVTGKNSERIVELMKLVLQGRQGMSGPDLIVYYQPAHSGQRGWANKTFVGMEIDIEENDLKAAPRLEKRLLTAAKKFFQALDSALTT